MYAVGELSNTIAVHHVPPFPESASLLQTMATFNSSSTEVKGGIGGEILFAPASNISPNLIYNVRRDDPSPLGDPIIIFSMDDDNKLVRVGECRTGLKHVRGMSFGGADNRYLIIGGLYGGGVKVYERRSGGIDLKLVAHLTNDIEAPNYFLWL